MARNQSQVYKVDERYSETKGASDNNVGLGFLRKYMAQDRAMKKFNIEAERSKDDRFIEAVPLAASNTYGNASYKNQFRASQGQEKNYRTIEDTEKQDQRTSLGEMVSQNIRSIYDKDTEYIADVRRKYYSS